MPKQLMLRLIQKGGRGFRAPALLARRSPLLGRLGRASRGYALAGAGVVVGAVVVVSLLSWLAPDSDRPISSPLEAIGRVAGGALDQVNQQVGTLLDTDGKTVLRSVREGLAAAGSATPWQTKSSEVASDPSGSGGSSSSSGSSSSTASPEGSVSSSGNGAAAPAARRESPSTASETPSQSAPAPSPASTGEAPSPAPDAPSPAPDEPAPSPATPDPPPAVEEPPPPAAEEPPATEEPPPPPTAEEPPPAAEEPPPVASDPPPPKEPPQTIADE